METWSDVGIVLKAQLHGEGGGILHVLTSAQGRHAGYVYGGGKRMSQFSIGMPVTLQWQARLESLLGTFRVADPSRALDPSVLDCPARLAALQSVCALLFKILPERLPCPALFAATETFLTTLIDTDPVIWGATLIHWEIGLLGELGYGLDISSCAATGVTEDLVWISPKSGRAVSRSAGEPWAARLLPLPEFLRPNANAAETLTPQSVLEGLTLTGALLERWPLGVIHETLPECRRTLPPLLERAALTQI